MAYQAYPNCPNTSGSGPLNRFLHRKAASVRTQPRVAGPGLGHTACCLLSLREPECLADLVFVSMVVNMLMPPVSAFGIEYTCLLQLEGARRVSASTHAEG